MKYKKAFSKYLSHADLPRPLTVTIARVRYEQVGKGDRAVQKLVVGFEELDQSLVLNRTNAEAIYTIVGADETDDWPGYQIELFPTTTSFRGKEVGCIRIRRPTPTDVAEESPL